MAMANYNKQANTYSKNKQKVLHKHGHKVHK